MTSSFQRTGVIALVVIAILLLWPLKKSLHLRRSPSQMRQTAQSAAAHAEGYVRRHVTGGVGVMLMINGNGLPAVNNVLLGSPAEIAGLRAGDVITKVNDAPTAGQKLTEVVESIRGFTGGHVTVTVQRGSTTNLTFVIRRSSWDGLGLTNIFDQPTLPTTSPMPISQPVPISTNTNQGVLR